MPSQPFPQSAAGTGPARFTLDRRLPASQQVYEDLRARIIALELAPGAALSRPALADFYRVSQTPVRDAFLKLEQEGLVEIYPQSRTLVAKIDVAQAREAQLLRTAIELEVTRVLARDGDKAKLLPVRRIVAQQKLAFEEEHDLPRFSQLDEQFHGSLCDAAGYPALWALVKARSGHIDRLRNLNLPDPGKAAAILAHHVTILRSMEASDEEATAKAVRLHLSGTLSAVDAIMARHPAFF